MCLSLRARAVFSLAGGEEGGGGGSVIISSNIKGADDNTDLLSKSPF